MCEFNGFSRLMYWRIQILSGGKRVQFNPSDCRSFRWSNDNFRPMITEIATECITGRCWTNIRAHQRNTERWGWICWKNGRWDFSSQFPTTGQNGVNFRPRAGLEFTLRSLWDRKPKTTGSYLRLLSSLKIESNNFYMILPQQSENISG